MTELAPGAPAATPLAALSQDRPILVLAPHPDDESLGCGALLAAAFAGPGAHVVCMTDGSASHPGSQAWPPGRLAALRAGELDAAVTALGGSPADVTRLGLRDAAMLRMAPAHGALAARIGAIARRIGARCLFAPAETDPHCDHVATARIAALVARRSGLRHLSYPVWSRWADPGFRERLPHRREHRFAAERARALKARAIACHRSQHGAVVTDDPGGFVLPADFVALFVDTDEIFFERATR